MIMGVETEFGMVGGSSHGRALAVQKEVSRSMPCIPSKGSGVYLANGGRAYVDAGSHNEYCTPETSDPAELVTHELAGRKLMADAASRAGQALLCSNVDPVYKTTWGSHENYSSNNRIDIPALQTPLLIHLASRLPYSGAGGLSLSHSGVGLIMSPRACFTKGSRGKQGIDRRTLIFNKPNNFGGEYRNHLLCGESLLCHYANYLKYATTALIVVCLDKQLPIFPGQFKQPLLQVMNQINRDVRMQRRYELVDGRRFSVLDVQESLLDGVESHLPKLPSWAPVAVAQWHQVIDDLRNERKELEARIDWMLYRHLLSELCREMGINAETLRADGSTCSGRGGSCLSDADQRELRGYRGYAREIYLRLHILGKESLFDQLEAEGRLNHHLPGISPEAVAKATDQPPGGRAAERSSLIREYWNVRDLKMTWNALVDGREHPPAAPIINTGAGEMDVVVEGNAKQQDRIRKAISEAEAQFRRGNYHEAIETLTDTTQILDPLDVRGRIETLCLSHARLGNKTTAIQMLEAHHGNMSGSYRHQVYSLFCAVNYGMKPPSGMASNLLRKCDRFLDENEATLDNMDYCRFILEQSRAGYLNSIGRCKEAEALCRKLLSNPHHQHRSRMMARTRCYLASALLSEGNPSEAFDELKIAANSQANEELFSDLATFNKPLHARMAESDASARIILREAELFQRNRINPLELAKVLAIKARRLKTSEDQWEIVELHEKCDALKSCALADRIDNNWDEWIAGPDPSNPYDYWGM